MGIRAYVFWNRADADSYKYTKWIYHFGATIIEVKNLPPGMRGLKEVHLHVPFPPFQLTIRIDISRR